MLIDCDTCSAPPEACGDCMMTVLLQVAPAPVELDDTERDALGTLARVGLIPPLRLVVGVESGFDGERRNVADQAERPDFTGGIRGIA